MTKYFCDLCGNPCEEEAKFEIEGKHPSKERLKFTVKVSAWKPYVSFPWAEESYQICNDCAIKAAGQALGLLPKPPTTP